MWDHLPFRRKLHANICLHSANVGNSLFAALNVVFQPAMALFPREEIQGSIESRKISKKEIETMVRDCIIGKQLLGVWAFLGEALVWSTKPALLLYTHLSKFDPTFQALEEKLSPIEWYMTGLFFAL